MKRNFYQIIGVSTDNFANLPKIRAELYRKPEDFVVEEIFPGRTCNIKREKLEQHFDSSKRFIRATLVKKNISTFGACKILALKNNLSTQDINYCGLKDTYGLTAQRISILNKSIRKLKYPKFGNFFLKDFEDSNKKMSIRDHRGNHFIIKARNISIHSQKCVILLNKFKEKINQGLPNFYGPQRFGIRQNNHKLGRLLMKKKNNKFVFRFLTETNNNESPNIRHIRREIKKRYGNWKECANIINNYKELSDEKVLILNLLRSDKMVSIKNMKISAFFIHAYISYLFNLALSIYLKKEYKNVKIKKIGKSSKLNKLNKSLYNSVFKKEGIKLEEIRSTCKEFSVEGHNRNSLLFIKNFDFRIDKKSLIMSFDLGQGQYASLILGYLFTNLTKKEKLD